MTNFIPTIPQSAMYTWDSQVPQYPAAGEPGLGYFAVIVGEHTIHCLLYRAQVTGRVIGILNYYDHDIPPWERAGSVNIFVHPRFKRLGIGRLLWQGAVKRWQVSFEGQRFSPEGAAFARRVSGG